MKNRNILIRPLLAFALFWVWNISHHQLIAESDEQTKAEWHQWRGPNRDGISFRDRNSYGVA